MPGKKTKKTTAERAKRSVRIYDALLRDGAQGEEINFSVEDKLRIVEKLDEVMSGLVGKNKRVL